MTAEGRTGGRRRRPPEAGWLAGRGRYAVLVAAVGIITVVVAPLIAPDRGAGPVGAPAATRTVPATSTDATVAPTVAPTVTPTVTPTLLASAGPSTAAAVPSCAPATAATVVAGLPACAVYTTALGNGWAIESTGVRVIAAGVVPGTDIVALRVEPQEKAASVSLVAAVPVRVPDGARLRFRVYGGRVHGTVLRVTVSADARPSGTAPVVLTAPVDVWTTFAVDLGTQHTVRRIDLVIATDLVPNAYRFFVDDLVFAP